MAKPAYGRTGDYKNERLQVALNYMAVADAATLAVGCFYLPHTSTILRAGIVLNADIGATGAGGISVMTIELFDRGIAGAGVISLGSITNAAALLDDTYIALVTMPAIIAGGSVLTLEVSNVDSAGSTPADFVGGTLWVEVVNMEGIGH